MRQHDLTTTHRRPKARRVGRGIAAGQGKTAGRGTKGQKARSGYNLPRTFIGGSTSLIQRLPKLKGFTSRATKPLTLNLARIAGQYSDGDTVTLASLLEKGIITPRDAEKGVKIVGSSGDVAKKLKFDTESGLQCSKKLLA